MKKKEMFLLQPGTHIEITSNCCRQVYTLMQNAHDSPAFNLHPNERAKLRNAWAMLNWYAYRFATKSGIDVTHPTTRNGVTVTPTTTIQELSDVWHGKTPALITDEIAAIIRWSWKFQRATPETSGDLARQTWIFLTNFNSKIQDQHVSKIATQVDAGKLYPSSP